MVMRISCTDRVYVLLMSYKEVLGSGNIFIIVFLRNYYLWNFYQYLGRKLRVNGLCVLFNVGSIIRIVYL